MTLNTGGRGFESHPLTPNQEQGNWMSTFEYHFSEAQDKAISEFCSKQEEKTGGEYGSIGGAYTYSFIPTSVGVVVRLKNTVTNEEIDLSDYESW